MNVVGKVGNLQVEWETAPTGRCGQCRVKVQNQWIQVGWERDSTGVVLRFENRIKAFDLVRTDGPVDHLGDASANDSTTDASHFKISERGGDGEWASLRWVRPFETAPGQGVKTASKVAKISAQMPGKIIKILVQVGETVVKNQALLVMEAMKMENEIRAPIDGRIKAIGVKEAQTVESGALLLTFDSPTRE